MALADILWQLMFRLRKFLQSQQYSREYIKNRPLFLTSTQQQFSLNIFTPK